MAAVSCDRQTLLYEKSKSPNRSLLDLPDELLLLIASQLHVDQAKPPRTMPPYHVEHLSSFMRVNRRLYGLLRPLLYDLAISRTHTYCNSHPKDCFLHHIEHGNVEVLQELLENLKYRHWVNTSNTSNPTVDIQTSLQVDTTWLLHQIFPKDTDWPEHPRKIQRIRDIVALLLRHGADANARRTFQQDMTVTLLYQIAILVMMACSSGPGKWLLPAGEELVVNGHANPNITIQDGKTPLHRAAMIPDRDSRCPRIDKFMISSQSRLLHLLLRSGANVDAIDAMGFTPLHCAAAYGARRECTVEGIKVLLEYGADINALIRPADGAVQERPKGAMGQRIHFLASTSPWTVLHLACFAGNARLVMFLLTQPTLHAAQTLRSSSQEAVANSATEYLAITGFGAMLRLMRSLLYPYGPQKWSWGIWGDAQVYPSTFRVFLDRGADVASAVAKMRVFARQSAKVMAPIVEAQFVFMEAQMHWVQSTQPDRLLEGVSELFTCFLE